jgi:SAM-dependent methyltransferase
MTANIVFMGYVKDPYQYVKGIAINLVSATCEPYGLTIIESLSRGIPVVAPNIDGPAEILTPDFLYEASDIAACVKSLETVILNYDKAVEIANTIYRNISINFNQSEQANKIKNVLDFTFRDFRKKTIPKEFTHQIFYSAISGVHTTFDAILSSISSSTDRKVEEITSKIELERAMPGSAMNSNIIKYDVVPFAYSTKMEDLYKFGDGFFIELLAHLNDPARKSMASYIILTLITEERRKGEGRFRVLAVGDGIGIDSMRLAHAGFDVDYIDVDRSITSSVAATNFAEFNASRDPVNAGNIRIVDDIIANSIKYDAILSLEVIEHVSDPIGFLQYLSGRLADNGLLFISDCFIGVDEQFPTHLSSNERYSFLLPHIASHCGLMLKGFSRNPNYKPFVFVKTSAASPEILNASLTAEFLELFIKHKESVCIRSPKGFDSVISMGRHVLHLVRSVLYRIWLRYSW